MKVYRVKRSWDPSESDDTPSTDYAASPPKRVKRTSTLQKPRLTQMTIDLGGQKVKRCPACEMEYVASSEEDVKMHQQYHSLNANCIDIPAKLLQNARFVTKQDRHRDMPLFHNITDRVIKISRSDSAPLRRLASRVLEVAEKELGAIRTTDAELWSGSTGAEEQSTRPLKACSSNTTERSSSVRNNPLHLIYLYLRNRRCVGVCLVKHIRNGRKVLPVGPGTDPTLMDPSYELFPASLGISRIWVSRLFRREGMAHYLLDAACNAAANGAMASKDRVAFSQPTAAGMALAKSWFGRGHGWLVFDDETCMMQYPHRKEINEEGKSRS